ncbi:winged helix-turn-helix domain-containing protein [Halobellus sp. H-GB7]|uniref:winged helix-turn-helix domain-containing protein n=1 Tax=Halobellus sp. H-GB7 TaxID=3069756 RepID=UPI0027B5931F|nr:winged helix-turn-helix domain-containing protein [Halobellus sp. H-GB7]MDQ2053257.1 winged helix-turn-helix domain-containing protein [Halobellus sp. H-GB7]
MTDAVLDDVPASAKFVHYVLEEADRPLTTSELADRTGLPERTIREAIDRLRDRNIVETRAPSPRNPNAPLHDISPFQ